MVSQDDWEIACRQLDRAREQNKKLKAVLHLYIKFSSFGVGNFRPVYGGPSLREMAEEAMR